MGYDRNLCLLIKSLPRSWFAQAGPELLKPIGRPVYCTAGPPPHLQGRGARATKNPAGRTRFVVLDWVLARRVIGVHLPTQVTPPYLDWFTPRFSYSKSSIDPASFVKHKKPPP